MGIINQTLATDVVKIALSSYLEGRGLLGDWRLEILNARLVPTEPPNGAPPETSAK